jgi:hypothetical protein
MLGALTEATRLVLVCNPNNPTATYRDADSIARFVEAVPENVTVILDEAYIDFDTGDDPAASIEPKTSEAKQTSAEILTVEQTRNLLLTATDAAPQFVPFLALTPAGWLGPRRRVVVVVLAGASLFLGQIVYPLNYSEFLECFNGEYYRNRIFWINVIKNLFWLAAVVAATLALLPRAVRESPTGG